MRHLKRGLGFVAIAAGAAFAMPAGAVEWLASPDSTSNNIYPNQPASGLWNGGVCSSPASLPAGCEQFSVTVGGQTLKVRAYSTTTASSAIPQPTGSWATADLVNYSGGFAVANRQPGDVVSEGSSPEHAVDNNGVVDVLVFELPQGQTWDLDQFRLGWADEAGVSRADVQAWFGGGGLGANYDFTKVCFTGCTALTDKTLTQLGIVQVGINGSAVGEDILPGSTFSSNVNFSGITPTGTEAKAGNYLIMTGQLGETNDAFKVQMLKATTHVPTPGTFALIGLGLFGLVTLRRRPVFA